MTAAQFSSQLSAATTMDDVRVVCITITESDVLTVAERATLQGEIDAKVAAINAALPPPVAEAAEREHNDMVAEYEAQLARRRAREL